MTAGPVSCTVVMPVHNAGHWLLPAVKSILNQTYADLELIVVDDSSDDGAVVDLDIDDPRFRFVQSPGRGVVVASNFGMNMASGRYIARMDADDIALPNRLADQTECVQRFDDEALVGGRIEIFSEEFGIAEGFRRYEHWLNGLVSPEDIQRQLFVESPLPNPTLLMHRSLWKRLGGYRDLAFPEDYDLLLRAWRAGIPMAKPARTVLMWRDSSTRLTRSDKRYATKQFLAAKAHHLIKGRFGADPVVIWGAGRDGVRLHDFWLAEGGRVTAFIDVNPKLVGGRRRGLPVFAHTQLAGLPVGFILACVGTRGAREKIGEALNASGRQEGTDYLCVL